MSMPRCGVKDKVGFGSDSRSKRYALQGSRWKVKALTYRISKYPKKLNRDDVDKEVAKAFAVWSEYTDLTFSAKKSSPVHIDIRFETGEHGDGDPFDGPGGTLAHAYFPVYGGDAHFDDAEQWTINSNRGTNLFQVAGEFVVEFMINAASMLTRYSSRIWTLLGLESLRRQKRIDGTFLPWIRLRLQT